MPFDFEPYLLSPRSNIRERVLKSMLGKAEERSLGLSLSLQEAERRGLSPDAVRVYANEKLVTDRASSRLRDELNFIKQQDAAETAAEDALRPLSRSRNRGGFYRSAKERSEAIA